MLVKIKETGEEIQVIPKSKDGKLHFLDIAGGDYYLWDQLKPALEIVADHTYSTNMQLQVNCEVLSEADAEAKKD